jgi:transposase-like protein
MEWISGNVFMHFLRNALDYVPRKVDDDCLQELRWFGACPRADEAGPAHAQHHQRQLIC